MLCRVKFVDVRIEHIERVGVPQRPHELARALLHRLVGEPIRQPRRTVLVKIPADRIRAVTSQRVHRFYRVALGLRHLLSVLILHMPEHDDVPIRTLVKEQRPDRDQRVEPPARLIDCLGDEVRGEMIFKDLFVFKRIMPLRERHRPGVEPAVDDLRYAVHRSTAFFAREGDLVDVRTVQLDVLRAVRLKFPEFRDRTDRALAPAVTFPNVQRRAPVAVAADTPVLHMLDPVAEAPLADRLRNPVDRVVVLYERIAHRRHLDEPRSARVVEQRRIAAPAMRIVVRELGSLKKLAALLEIGEDQRIGVLHKDARPFRLRRHLALVVDELHERHPVFTAHAVVVLAECRRRMDDARAVLGRHIVVADDEERLFAHIRGDKIVERLIPPVLELLALHRREDLTVAPRAFKYAVHQRLGEVVDLAVDTHLHIGHLGVHAEPEIRRQRPRCRRPCEEIRILIGSLELDDCRTLRDIFVPLRHLVRGERRAAARAVRNDLVSLIKKSFFIDFAERPPHGLDVIVLVGDVGVLHIRPKTDDVGELLPHRLIRPDRFAAFLDERLDAVFFDLFLAVDADRLLDLELHGQPVRVPARLAQNLLALHRLIARQHVLDYARQHMPDVRAAVRRRRAVVKRERLCTLALIHRLLCNMIFAPKIHNGFLARGKIQICIYFIIQKNPSRTVVTSF